MKDYEPTRQRYHSPPRLIPQSTRRCTILFVDGWAFRFPVKAESGILYTYTSPRTKQ